MSQRYIFLKMASYKELKDEGYGSFSSIIDVPRLRRRSSASLPSNRSSRAPSLRHFRNTPATYSLNTHESPRVLHGTPSSTGSAGVPIRDGSLLTPLKVKHVVEYPDDSEVEKLIPSIMDEEVITYVDDMDDDDEAIDRLLQDPARCQLSKEAMFLVACLVVLATSGGLILGFGPVYSTLLREDQWSELCDDTGAATPRIRSDGSVMACAKQEIRLQYVFSTSFLCLSAANAFFGVFLDVAGPRLTALVGLAMSTLGNFALAHGDSHSGTGAYIILGYSLIGAGGMGSYLAAFQILQLFEVQGFVCSALSSLFNCSGYLFMLLQVDGIGRPAFFRIYGMIVMACMVLCFLLFPTNNIVRPHDRLAIPTFHVEAPRWVNPLGLMTGMREQLKRPDLWFFAIYFGWISLIFGFAGGAIPSILASLGVDNPPAVATYTNILYPVLVNGTFIYSPAVGYIIDHYGFKVIFVACLIMVQGFIALLLVPSLHVQILTFFVYALAQACLYALQFAYIMMCFPPELYGTLQAFLAIISFMFGLFNYLLNPWTQMYLGGNYTIVLLVLGTPTAILYFFIHVVQGCEDQTIKYDSGGNPIVTSVIPIVSSSGKLFDDADDHMKLRAIADEKSRGSSLLPSSGWMQALFVVWFLNMSKSAIQRQARGSDPSLDRRMYSVPNSRGNKHGTFRVMVKAPCNKDFGLTTMTPEGGSARVQLHAIAGLAASHTAPFVRLLHDDVIARRHDKHKQAIVAVELPEDQELPVMCKRSHHVRSEYTALWDRDQPCTACLPLEVDWIEVQVWNRFADVAVFLGVTKISLREARRASKQSAEARDDAPTRSMWYPMDPGRDVAGLSRSAFHLSVQLSLSWHAHDSRTMRIQKQITERREGKRHAVATEEDGDETTPSAVIVVDPSFQFEDPSTTIEWSSVVGANVRRMFLQGDIDELQLFYDDVLHGDMEQEIEDDDGLVIDEDHLKAFRLCQLSAQYLDHCVTLLDGRKEEYTEHHRTLASTRRDRRRDHKQLVDQKRRLQKELGDLDLLVSTYGKLLEHHGKSPHPADQDPQGPSPAVAPAPRVQEVPTSSTRDIDAVVSKKPAFLMTWEEREQARKEQKERDRSRRIEEEKLRLQRLFQERQERELIEDRLSSLAQRRRNRSARVLQAAARSFLTRRRTRHIRALNLAARKLQSHARRFVCMKQWPRTRDLLQRNREQRRMHQCDREGVEMRRREREEWTKQQEQLRQSHNQDIRSDDDDSLGSPSGNPVQALELVAMWKKLKRILTLACEKGASPSAVFKKLDTRGDNVVDRAEFRLGVRYFGVRMNRKMTRAIISLARAKCGDPPRPLTLTEAQFARGFELPQLDASPASQSTASEFTERQERKASPDSPRWEGSASERRSRASDDGDNSDRETSQTIEEVAMAVANLRRRVLEAAQDYVAAQHKSVTDYYAFREALTHVFEEFDVDGNGELDLHELVECMAAINFRVTPENLAIVRECFVSDATSESVSISEFISFALSGMQSSSLSKKPVDEELGILGYRLRDAILGKVKIARKQTASIEDAVRLVFKGAYRTKTQDSCPRRDFARVLASLRLGFTPAQLSRLVLRLDQDGDNTVSFDEVLTWLRLRMSSEVSPVRVPEIAPTSRSRTPVYSVGDDTVKLIQAVFLELANASDPTMSYKTRYDRVASLFRRIDRNGSKKINANELEEFLSGVEFSELRAVSQLSDNGFDVEAAQLAQEAVKLIDFNGNGVVTLEEWTGFMVETRTANQGGRGPGDRYAIVEGVRQAMRDAFADEVALLTWFRAIPGAIVVDSSPSKVELKVRAREFKNAMRAKLSYIEVKDLDEAVRILDVDGSGWITEKELRGWQYPTRDIEELTAQIARVWAAERQSPKLKELPGDTFVEALYRRFDQDGNGLIARKELREGFQSFRITLNDEEALQLINEFDSDRDGFWSKAEFVACVNKLLHFSPATRVHTDRQQPVDEYSSDSQHSDEGGYDSPDPDHTELDGLQGTDKTQGEDDEEEEEDVYSLGELSPPAMSPIQFDEDAVARSMRQKSTGIEYSEDFDDDA